MVLREATTDRACLVDFCAHCPVLHLLYHDPFSANDDFNELQIYQFK